MSRSSGMIYLPEKSAHWYKPDGTPCHQVPKKGGKGMRSVNLRWDAHLNLYPSVTNILSVKAKPGLDNYKFTQTVMACLTLPPKKDELLDDFANRIAEDMSAHSEDAAKFGARIHKYLEKFHLGDESIDTELEPYVKSYKDWFRTNVKRVIHAEKVVVNSEFGYAGTMDCMFEFFSGSTVIGDVKTQGVKDSGPKAYPEWMLQLVAYGRSETLEKEPDGYISFIIDSATPGPVTVKVWGDDREKAWNCFRALRYVWAWDKKYFPGKVVGL